MRVLFVISSLNTGGAQRALSNIVTNLPGGWEIDILLNNTNDIVYPYSGNLIDLSIKEPSDRNNIFYQLKVFIKRYSALRRLKREGSYDACISFLDSANFVNIVTGRKYCKTVISSRIILTRNKSALQSCINLMVRTFYNRACRIVAVSEGVKADLTSNLGIKKDIISVIYNGYPLDEIRSRAGLRQGGGSTFTFITAGRCGRQKGQWHLIRAFSELLKKHNACRLVILGDGPYLQYYKQLIEAYQIQDKVLLKGFVDNPFSELINADAFVFPSLFEGFPNALIEAMVCGLPAIASDFRSGAREILAPGTDIGFEQKKETELAEFGIITPVCSGVKHTAQEPLEQQEKLLLEAMELVCTDTAVRERYSSAAQKRAEDFSVEKSVNQWIQLISIISETSSP